VKTSSLDRIPASVPVNRQAAVVIGKGVHWEPAKTLIQPWDAWQETPLPIFPLTSSGAVNLAGLRVGRLTVLGFGGSGGKGISHRGRWVVRCTCGMYGHHKAKFLRSENAKISAMCPKCHYLVKLKAGRVPLKVSPNE
jgi:hypothetical protein